jgi:hypothetical protein
VILIIRISDFKSFLAYTFIKQKGVSLLELMLTITLSAVFTSLFFKEFLFNAAIAGFAQKKEVEQYGLAMLQGYIHKLEDAIITSPLTILPRIHMRGTLRYQDRTANRIAARSAIAENSEAITGVGFDISKALTVEEIVPLGRLTQIEACQRYPGNESFIKEDFERIAGFGAEVSMELFVYSIQFIKKPHTSLPCVKIHVTPAKSMSFDTPRNTELLSILMLIPIKEHFTLYVDRNRVLRYLSHRGHINKENQPITKGIQSLTFKHYLPLKTFPFHYFSVTGSLSQKRQKTSVLLQRAAFQNRENFLLNSP